MTTEPTTGYIVRIRPTPEGPVIRIQDLRSGEVTEVLSWSDFSAFFEAAHPRQLLK